MADNSKTLEIRGRKKTRHESVMEMVRALSEDASFADSVEKKIAERNIVTHLMALRAAEGLSQGEIARKMSCSQSRISKLESSKDEDLRIGDFHGYAEALGLQMMILLGGKDRPPIAKRIKYHFSALQQLINELADLVGDDDAMKNKMGEVVMTGVRTMLLGAADLLERTAGSMPKPKSESPSPIGIEIEKVDHATTHCELSTPG